jgi:hypothetical protein
VSGKLYLDALARLWVCLDGFGSGIWVRMAAVFNGTLGGALSFLAHPIRIFDSRVASGAPLPAVKARVPANTVQSMQVTGTDVGGIHVPAGAGAVIANATAVNTGGPGFVSFWPHGAPFPGVSNLNYVGGQIVANFCIVGLDASGQLDYEAGGGSSTALLFDVAGFVL